MLANSRNVLTAVWLFKQAGKSFRRLEESASQLNLATAEEQELQVSVWCAGYIRWRELL